MPHIIYANIQTNPRTAESEPFDAAVPGFSAFLFFNQLFFIASKTLFPES